MVEMQPWEIGALGLKRYTPKRRALGGPSPSIRSKEVLKPARKIEVQLEYPNLCDPLN